MRPQLPSTSICVTPYFDFVGVLELACTQFLSCVVCGTDVERPGSSVGVGVGSEGFEPIDLAVLLTCAGFLKLIDEDSMAVVRYTRRESFQKVEMLSGKLSVSVHACSKRRKTRRSCGGSQNIRLGCAVIAATQLRSRAKVFSSQE